MAACERLINAVLSDVLFVPAGLADAEGVTRVLEWIASARSPARLHPSCFVRSEAHGWLPLVRLARRSLDSKSSI